MRRRRDMPTPSRDLPWGSPRSLPAMPALRAHTESELQRQLLVAAVWTSLRRVEPVGLLGLTRRTHQHLFARDDRARPRRRLPLRRVLLHAATAHTRHAS